MTDLSDRLDDPRAKLLATIRRHRLARGKDHPLATLAGAKDELQALVSTIDANASKVAMDIARWFQISFERAKETLSYSIYPGIEVGYEALLGSDYYDWGRSHLAARSKASSVVYFVSAPSALLIKIGTTGKYKSRMDELSAMSPVPLIALGVMPGSFIDERLLHYRFRHFRRHGEWFTDALEIRDFITANCLIERAA